MTEVYDSIGRTYNTTRGADPRIAQAIWSALEGCGSVLNVGAGTGAYEPTDRAVVAVEPSATMRRARPEGSAPCIAGSAESLPFDDRSFDAAMAILTVHHWSDYRAGLCELRRVARRVLVLHWDQAVMDRSGWPITSPSIVSGDGLERLQRDLSEGTWAARYHALLDQTELDCGYRIVLGVTGARAARQDHLA